jgi:phospholipid/cholesterol/gamma-HCH transport system ATP-binding protein
VVVPQLEPTPGLPVRQAVQRRKDRVMGILHTLSPAAQTAIMASLTPADRERYHIRPAPVPQEAGPQNTGRQGPGVTAPQAAQTRPMQPAGPRPAAGPPPGQPGPRQAPYTQPPGDQSRYGLPSPNPNPPAEPGHGGRA